MSDSTGSKADSPHRDPKSELADWLDEFKEAVDEYHEALKQRVGLPALRDEFDNKVSGHLAALEKQFAGDKLLEELSKARELLEKGMNIEMNRIVFRCNNATNRILDLRHRLPQLLRPLAKQSENAKSALDELLHPTPPNLLNTSYIIAMMDDVVHNRQSAPPDSDAAHVKKSSTPFPTPKDAAWKEVSITFISEFTVQVKVRDATEARNYAEMGFGDRRSKNNKPTLAWIVLRQLAERDGRIERPPQFDRPGWRKIEPQIATIRRKLHELFRIGGDPFKPFREEGQAYQARFVIQCAGSYRS